MPTYVYACNHCEFGFEKQQGFSEDALTTCPECGHESLRKVYNAVGVVFKGSGFYKTDSRSSGTGGSASNSTSSSSSTSTSH